VHQSYLNGENTCWLLTVIATKKTKKSVLKQQKDHHPKHVFTSLSGILSCVGKS